MPDDPPSGDHTGSTGEAPPPGPPAPAPVPHLCARGDQIGPYRLVSPIGEGGFGEVWLAEQLAPIARHVALKVILPGMDSRAVIARFEAERQALAMMNHPNIARVFDAGATAAGRPYFVMEHIKGESISTYCDKHRLSIRRRLELFALVCDAVQHAHTKGIIHRDLKPSNILVAVAENDRPRPVVIDFGVAKALNQRLTERTLFTERGQMIGTPAYMAPEQAEMAETDIDTRSDVYSLGVVLYELLAGAPPFDPAELRRLGYAAFMKIIRDLDPPRPSTRLSSLGEAGPKAAANRGSKLPELSAQLKNELEWIPLKAMRKDRTERYRSAAELADDIGNYLANKPLIAGPESAAYRLRKFVRRNKGPVAAMSGMLLVLAVGVGGTYWGMVQAVREKAVAERQRDNAARIADFMQNVFAGVRPAVARSRDTAVLKELVDSAAARITSGELADLPEAEIALLLTISRVYREIGELEHAEGMVVRAEKLARTEDATSQGGESAKLAATLDAKALVLQAKGREVEAEELFRQSLDIRRRHFKLNHPDVAASYDNLGLVLQALGRTSEAVDLHSKALRMNRQLFPADHAQVAQSLNNCGLVQAALGRAAEAVRLHGEALKMRRKLFSFDHPDVTASNSNLAIALQMAGRETEAEPLYALALTSYRLLHDGDHAETATALGNLASVRQTLGRPREAEPLFQEALEMRRRLFPGDHPDVALSLNNLAAVKRDLGRTAGVEPLYQEALDMNRRFYKGDHPRVASTLSNLGLFLLDTNRARRGESLLQEALGMSRRLFPEGHADTAKILTNLGMDRHRLDRSAEAEPLVVEALEMNRRLLSEPHRDVAAGLNNLATVRWRTGRTDEAESLLQECLTMSRRLYPGDHPSVAGTLSNLATLRNELGRATEAEPLLVEALEMQRRLYRGNHEDVARTMSNLSRTLMVLRRFDEALDKSDQAIAMLRALRPGGSPLLALAISGGAAIRHARGDPAAALPLIEEAIEMGARVLPPDHRWIADFRLILSKIHAALPEGPTPTRELDPEALADPSAPPPVGPR